MANNKVSSLLNIDLPTPKRSNFNLGRVNRFSADVGWVIPCYVEEILPNSYKRLDVNALIQTNATVAPLMGSFKVKIDAFFVPLRLYHRHLSLNNINPNFSDDFDYHYFPFLTHSSTVGDPYKVVETNRLIDGNYAFLRQQFEDKTTHFYIYNNDDYNTIGVAPSSLIDYLGMMPNGLSPLHFTGRVPKLCAYPFIAYFDIWRNYYSNPHDPNVPFRVQNYIDVSVDDRFRPTYNQFINLEQIDNFINNINSLSVDNIGVPRALDILDRFRIDMSFHWENVEQGTIALHTPPLFQNQALLRGIAGGTDGEFVELFDTSNGMHFGLLPRTYMDDYFNSRFRNDFVTYMEESSRITIQNNSFTINQLRQGNRVAKYVDKSIFSDTRFGSWIKAHFGVKTNQKLDIPQFLGSITSNIVFNDIYATAQTGDGDITSNKALGSRSSLGQGYIQNKGAFVEFKATEPGYLMCTFSIIPYVSYFQGIKKMYLKDSFFDMYRPEFDAIGYDDLQKAEMSVIPFPRRLSNNIDPILFSSWNTSVGKHPSWLEYMTSYDESHGLMTEKYQYGFWTLNRPYSPDSYDDNVDAMTSSFEPSTYITPEYFNAIFAVDKFTDNFQVQIRFYDKTKQPISKQILPHL